MRVGVVGQTARDIVVLPGRPPEERLGGTPLYAARALRFAGVEPVLVTKGPPLEGAVVLPSRHTFVSHLDHAADGLHQRVGAVGDPFTPDEVERAIVPALRGCSWAILGGQTAGDFPPATIAALARAGLQLLLDAQGVARGHEPGPVRLRPFAAEDVRGVQALKLNELEAEAAAGGIEPERLLALGAPEVLVTMGYTGGLVITADGATEVPASPVRFADPTGAGDSWSALYAAARTAGEEPAAAARTAGAQVERLYAGPSAGEREARNG